MGIVGTAIGTGNFPPASKADADSRHMISLYADGSTKVFSTDATTVGDVLKSSNVTLRAGDLVEPAVDTVVPSGFFNVNVYRARPVLVVDGVRSYHLASSYQSPRLLAEAAGLTVYPEDTYTTEVSGNNIVTTGAVGATVTVHRATPFSLRVDGKTETLRTQKSTVGEALEAAHVAMGARDTVSVPLNAVVQSGMAISITRVTEADVEITETISRAQQTISDPTMLKGQTKVQDEGADGQKVALYRIHYQNGLETSRKQLQLVSQTPAEPRITVVGTKVLFAGSVEYWRPQVEVAASENGLDPNMMMRIMACESGGNATTVSRFVVNGQHPTGLFQYLPSTWRSAGGTDDNILDGAVQIKLTAKYMARNGTGAWECR